MPLFLRRFGTGRQAGRQLVPRIHGAALRLAILDLAPRPAEKCAEL
jgi:hypothetical protein